MKLIKKATSHLRTKRGWSQGGAFTLVELMVVVAVIGIIAGIVLAAAGGAQKKAARDQTKAEIKTIIVALDRYRTAYGSYPLPSNNPSRTTLYPSLTNFMTFKTNQVTNNTVLDPYGYAYWYRLVTNGGSSGAGTVSITSESVEVWSVGVDGKSGFTNTTPDLRSTNNLDDLTSWN